MKLTPTQQIAAACLLWSIAALSRKLVLVSISPFFLNFLNCIFGVIIVAIASKTNFVQLLIKFSQNKTLFTINSIFGITIGISLSYYSIERIDLSLYGLLVKIQPIFVIILAYIFLKEKIVLNKIPYMACAILSSFLISYNDGIDLTEVKLIGIIAAILTALSFSISTITGKALMQKDITPDQTTIIRFFLGAFLLTPALFFEPLIKTEFLNLQTTLWLFLGIICSASAFILYYKSLKHLGAIKATILELLMPIFTVSMGVIFLNETLSILQVAASILLVLSIVKLELS